MPLIGTDAVLAEALKAALLGAGCGAVDNTALTGMCTALATTLIAHLTVNTDVSPAGTPPMTVAGVPVAGLGKLL